MGRLSLGNKVELKNSVVGPVNGTLILLFEHIQSGFGNCGELTVFDQLLCWEILVNIIIVSVTRLRVYAHKWRV